VPSTMNAGPIPISLNETCSHRIALLRKQSLMPLLESGKYYSRVLAPSLGSVEADPHQLEQIILNLSN